MLGSGDPVGLALPAACAREAGISGLPGGWAEGLLGQQSERQSGPTSGAAGQDVGGAVWRGVWGGERIGKPRQGVGWASGGEALP